jgi:ADP-heptose:LPS heptosyltransferase
MTKANIVPDNAIQRITLLSFRTFGDYVLKAPFLFELARLYPNAEVTMITNRKGGQVYPLVDSRLKLVIVDHGDPKLHMLRTLLACRRRTWSSPWTTAAPRWSSPWW